MNATEEQVRHILQDPKASPLDKGIATAWKLEQDEKFEEASEKWRSIANIQETTDKILAARFRFLAGNSLRKINQQAAAIAEYDKAISMNPKYAIAYYNRANAKAEFGEYEKAIKDYDQALRLNPDFVGTWGNRGNAKAELKQYKEAIKDYEKIIEIDPKSAVAWLNLGVARYALEKYEDALSDFNEAIRLNPDYIIAWDNRGKTELKLGRLDDARRSFEKALDLAKEENNTQLIADIENQLQKLDNTEDKDKPK